MDPTTSVAAYKDFIDQQLCWIHGVPTHASSALQRQCPTCRTKWSYEHLALELAALEHYCRGENASETARRMGCAKNTALKHHASFRQGMERFIAEQLIAGTIATNPVTMEELGSLEKALRTGSNRRRGRACRHIFLRSLSFEERMEAIFQHNIVPEILSRTEYAVNRLKSRGAEQPVILLAAERRQGIRKRPAQKSFRQILVEAWISFWRERRARFDQNCPYPSRVCEKLGKLWVLAWFAVQKMRCPTVNCASIPVFEGKKGKTYLEIVQAAPAPEDIAEEPARVEKKVTSETAFKDPLSSPRN